MYLKNKSKLHDSKAVEAPRPGTAPSGMLRKVSNLTDQPQYIARGEMASSVTVNKDATATVAAAFGSSPYAKPIFPQAILPKSAQVSFLLLYVCLIF